MERKTQGQRGRQAYYGNNNFLLKMSGLGCWWPGGCASWAFTNWYCSAAFHLLYRSSPPSLTLVGVFRN
ncbi:hypothetical protein MGG_15956 [Pyricularia oryzae 70-15]|uniref:Uncharacterized protein n=2 Tax=Pyricularia oryzae TaxID=318829 RepID=G4MX79_PYRO7|nr:uncharacterized protein MGG_15956 [Pyricularia oryzae 70-15]EHA55977.1 hypothetical protein MGG_15956 [Pyricularia oryzae 70-15]ELQ34435.1 hypothetical protein OOU_Y34scaffold00766g14 [Pyricularia oryzae Y34]